MKITITARHFEASQNLKDYTEKSLKKLEKYFDRIVSCDVVFEETASTTEPQKVEIHIKIPQKTLSATESSAKYEKAISLAVDNLKRQIKRYKEKKLAY